MKDWLILSIGIAMAAILPEVALGASIGSLFYLLSSKDESGIRKFLLIIIGWMLGYSLGQPFQDGGWAMLISILGSAFAVTIMIQVFDALDRGSADAPPFAGWLVDVINKIRGG